MLFLSILPLLSLVAASQVPFSTYLPPTSSYHPTSLSSSIEFSGSLVRQQIVYKLTHDGSSDKDWVVGVKGQGEDWVEVREQGKEKEIKRLGRTASGVTYYSVTPSPPTSGQSSTLTLNTVSSHQTKPFPPALPQTIESITMMWENDLTSVLAGLTDAEKEYVDEIKIKVKAPSPKVVVLETPAGFDSSHTKGGATITFTSNNQLALEKGPQIAKVQYAQPEAIATIRKLDRTLQVSHWGGSIAIMDDIELVNSGPTLLGHFSRLEHQKRSMQRRASGVAITSLSVVLPPRATSPYYYDIVGNVSTSHFRSSTAPLTSGQAKLPSMRKGSSNSLLELTPRYPVMGGWNYTFTMGYDVPLPEYLKKSQGRYVLAVPFLTPIKDVAVDNATVSILLPEGARIVKIHTPFAVDSISQPATNWPMPLIFGPTAGYTKTYLDSTGRPTVVLRKSHCTDKHGGDVIIEYELSLFAEYLQKPLAIGFVLASFFAIAALISKMELGINK